MNQWIISTMNKDYCEKDRNSSKIMILSCCLIGLSLLHTFVFRNYITDDAYISFRYLDNFLNGHGLVFNQGERVWGYTNFLWIAMLVPGVGVGIDPLVASRILGVGFNLGTLILVMMFHLKQQKKYGIWEVGAGFLLVSNGAFLLQSLSGLETSFFTFLVVLNVFLYQRFLESRRLSLLIWIGILAALSTLTRPDGLFFFGVFCLHMLIEQRQLGFSYFQIISRSLLGFVPLVSVCVLLGYLYYGAVWPNSLNAKVGLSTEQIYRGLHYLMKFAHSYSFSLGLLLLSLIYIKKASIAEKFIIQLSCFVLVFYVMAGGDWMRGFRLFHVFIPLTCLLLPFAFRCLEDQVQTWSFKSSYLTLPILGLGVLLTLSASLLIGHVRDSAKNSYVHEGVLVGKWMQENIDPNALLATNTAGTVAYFSRLPIIDMMGLNDKVIASRKDIPEKWKGIEKGDGAYVLSRNPDYIQLGSSKGIDRPVFLSDAEIYQSRDFWTLYKKEVHHITDQIKLVLYKKRQTPGQESLSEQKWQEIKEKVDYSIANSAFRY